MFRTFDHTADIGLAISAPSFPELLAEAGRGFFSLIVANLEDVQPVDSRLLQVTGDEREYVLFDFLNELLYLFDQEHFLASAFEIRLSDGQLQATVKGELLDRQRHRLEHEVKAVTYHGLAVEQREQEWYAEVIFDI